MRTSWRGVELYPDSQAFIESWFGQFKNAAPWRAEWESIDQARREIDTYVEGHHDRPHSGLGYRTPAEVATTWQGPQELQSRAT